MRLRLELARQLIEGAASMAPRSLRSRAHVLELRSRCHFLVQTLEGDELYADLHDKRRARELQELRHEGEGRR